jgi:hypothetical protein
LKIALVHDSLTQSGEREKFLFALMELFPGADIFTLAYRPEKFGKQFEGRRVTTSFLQRLPLGSTHPALYLPLYHGFMRSLDVSGYDLIISSSAAVAKWVLNPKKITHVCWCHSLLGGLWENEAPVEGLDFPGWEKRVFGGYLRRCDLRSNEGVTHFLVGSEAMKERVGRIYGREADVIPLPLDEKFLFRVQVYFRRLYGIKSIGEE